MTKRIFTLLTLVAILVVATNASERTDIEMRSVAASYLLPGTTRGAASVPQLNTVIKDRFLTVYAAEGCGFVVISRDDLFPAVIGISDRKFDADNMAPGFSWWLEEVSRSMKRRLEGNIWYEKRAPSTVVESFITTRWDQRIPYNLKCPKIAADYCPTGCVATAAAQVMKYYNYPAQSQGKVNYTKNSLPKTATLSSVYDWDNMLDYYASTQKTLTPTTEAVATLMFDAGAASQMAYTGSAGGTNLTYCAQGLVNNFKYDSLSLQCLYREFYTDVEWRDMVYTELAKKQPVLYAGHPEDGTAGHAFVLDGIDAEGKVHVNWGWSGSCDGYYDLFLLSPGEGAQQAGDYSFYNQMVFGFNPTETPAEGTSEHSVWISDSTYWFSIDNTDSLTMTARGIFNYNYRDFYGKLIIKMDNINGNADDSWDIILHDTEEEGEYAGPIEPQYGFVFNSENRDEVGSFAVFDLKDDKVKPGTYVISLVSLAVKETNPSPIRYLGGKICKATLTKTEDGKLSIVEGEPTGINVVKASERSGVKSIYDMSGRRVYNAKSGIYIMNNKKVKL